MLDTQVVKLNLSTSRVRIKLLVKKLHSLINKQYPIEEHVDT